MNGFCVYYHPYGTKESLLRHTTILYSMFGWTTEQKYIEYIMSGIMSSTVFFRRGKRRGNGNYWGGETGMKNPQSRTSDCHAFLPYGVKSRPLKQGQGVGQWGTAQPEGSDTIGTGKWFWNCKNECTLEWKLTFPAKGTYHNRESLKQTPPPANTIPNVFSSLHGGHHNENTRLGWCVEPSFPS